MTSVIVWTAVVALGAGFVALTVWFVRWFFRRPRHVNMPSELVEAITEFAGEFQKAADGMVAVAQQLTLESRLTWEKKNSQILHSLRKVNRILQELNAYFDEERKLLEEQRRDPESRRGDAGHACDTPKAKPPRDINAITPEERGDADWDDIIKY